MSPLLPITILPYMGEDAGSQAVPDASWLMGSFRSMEDAIPDMLMPGMAWSAPRW